MPLSVRDRTTVEAYLQSHVDNLTAIRGQLKTGRQLMPVRYENFGEVKWWLKASVLVLGDDGGVREAADLIQAARHNLPAIVVETAPPPVVDIAAEKRKITDDCGHAATIDGVYVQLDTAQNKHQPRGVPIGTRVAEGEKFGTYATKAWHERTTMAYMARWAAGLTDLVEGKKREHGQTARVDIETAGRVSFEGFCMLLGDTRYVSFHCYPNSR